MAARVDRSSGKANKRKGLAKIGPHIAGGFVDINIHKKPVCILLVRQRKMKTIFLYAPFLLGISNFFGLVIGWPLGIVLIPLSRLINPTTSIGSWLLSIYMGLSMG